MFPSALSELISFFEHLPEQERRENLIALADQAKRYEPAEDEHFDFQDVRKDAECTDTVGVFVRVGADQRAHFAVSLGPKVQTLTRAMAVVLCRGLEGAQADEIRHLSHDFIPRIIGEDLVRQRSRTVHYVLDRMQTALATLIEQRAGC